MKYNYTEKTIKRIKLDNGHEIVNQKEILQAIQNFYSTLFSEQTNCFPNENLDTLLEGTTIRKLTTLESNLLDGELEMEKLGQTLKQMKNGKCPGVDGFPADFFKLFWGKLKFFILRGLNYTYIVGEMSTTIRTCIISCLPKGDKPREYLKTGGQSLYCQFSIN